MTNKEIVLDFLTNMGLQAVAKLQTGMPAMDGTELIDEQRCIPEFDPIKQYLSWEVGSVIQYDDQVWQLIQPYDSLTFTDPPDKLRAHWGICHTKDPYKAKPFIPSYGTSGMYMEDECCTENNKVYRCKRDNVVFRPSENPNDWVEIEV